MPTRQPTEQKGARSSNRVEPIVMVDRPVQQRVRIGVVLQTTEGSTTTYSELVKADRNGLVTIHTTRPSCHRVRALSPHVRVAFNASALRPHDLEIELPVYHASAAALQIVQDAEVVLVRVSSCVVIEPSIVWLVEGGRLAEQRGPRMPWRGRGEWRGRRHRRVSLLRGRSWAIVRAASDMPAT